jgi:hypothetical protein
MKVSKNLIIGGSSKPFVGFQLQNPSGKPSLRRRVPYASVPWMYNEATILVMCINYRGLNYNPSRRIHQSMKEHPLIDFYNHQSPFGKSATGGGYFVSAPV